MFLLDGVPGILKGNKKVVADNQVETSESPFFMKLTVITVDFYISGKFDGSLLKSQRENRDTAGWGQCNHLWFILSGN